MKSSFEGESAFTDGCVTSFLVTQYRPNSSRAGAAVTRKNQLPIPWIVRVHGISGITGYREFNKPLELVRTMPG